MQPLLLDDLKRYIQHHTKTVITSNKPHDILLALLEFPYGRGLYISLLIYPDFAPIELKGWFYSYFTPPALETECPYLRTTIHNSTACTPVFRSIPTRE